MAEKRPNLSASLPLFGSKVQLFFVGLFDGQVLQDDPTLNGAEGEEELLTTRIKTRRKRGSKHERRALLLVVRTE